MSNELRRIQISEPVTGDEEWYALRESLQTGWLTSGPKVREFEASFAERHQVPYAIAVTSATTALHLALHSLGIGPGDEVIVPAFTWVSTANVVEMCGATPVFVDVDPKTFNIDVSVLAKAITHRTRAVIPVHLFGLCAEMDAIKQAVGDIPLVEDAACASGASYKGVPAGGIGTIGCFSFHPRKSVTTGEGGMLTTRSSELAARLEMLRNHGASISEEQRHNGPKPYLLAEFNMMGFNYRMTDLQGAVGTVQLSKLDKFIEERKKWASYYSHELADLDWLQCPSHPEYQEHGWQSYVTLVDESRSPVPRNLIMQRLQDRGISTRPGTHAVHMLGYYSEKYKIQPGDYPGAQLANDCSMAIPLHNKMTEADYAYVVEALHSVG
jgi:perosamine synthetase